MRRTYLLAALILLIICNNHLLAQRTLTNPVKQSGPDPWVVFKDGWYYYMNTTGNNLTLWKTRDMADLATAEKKVIFKPPTGTPYSRDLWAPEIHHVQGKWYVYFAADSINNLTHRIWVLENSSADPTQGEWMLKGKLTDPGDHWAIDLSVFEHADTLYATWSGWEGAVNGRQDIYIAKLKNPWTMDGDRVKISQPDQPWEMHGDVPQEWQKNGEVPKIFVNEGPEFLRNGQNLFIIYSANACWLDYCYGLLQHTGGSLMEAKNWRKHPQPVFTQSPEESIYAPGHGGFFLSPDGKESWMIYHANRSATDGCGDKRAPHMQPFTWNADGTPNFGRPVRTITMPVATNGK